jgi:hypothetical protein
MRLACPTKRYQFSSWSPAMICQPIGWRGRERVGQAGASGKIASVADAWYVSLFKSLF